MGNVKFSIRIIDKNNTPYRNIKVTVFDKGFLGTQHDSEYTNSEGWVRFEFYCTTGKFNAEIYAQNRVAGNNVFYSGDTYSLVF